MWDSVAIETLGGSPSSATARLPTPFTHDRALPPAATKSYSVASVWERKASLTDTQQRAIEVLSTTCSQRPIPQHVSSDSSAPKATPATAQQQPTHDAGPLSPHSNSGAGVELSFAGTSFEDVVLQNSSEFYRWMSELEAARASETEGKYQRHAAVLDGHLTACEDLLATIGEVSALFESLKEGQRAVSGRTAALHVTCERLVAEQEALVQTVDALRAKLAYFDELDTVAAQFHSASLSLEDADVLSSLQRLDECLAFLASHPHYADAAPFAAKFRQLQSRALGAVRAKVQQSLKSAALSVQRATGDTNSTTTNTAKLSTASGAAKAGVAPDGAAETTLLCVRFRAAVEPPLKGLLGGIEARAETSAEYARLLRDCQTLHCETRLALMRGPVATQLAAQAGQPLSAVVRSGCAFLLHVAQLEAGLFEALFSASASKNATATALAPLMDPLCILLYDALRPALVSLRDVDELCELGFVLKEEALGESARGSIGVGIGGRGGGGSGVQSAAASTLDPVLGRALGDVQERLAYRAMAFIREKVANFTPAPGDLDYPALLLVQQQEQQQEQQQRVVVDSGNGEGEQKEGEVEGESEATEKQQLQQEMQQQQYVGWYPPVQRSLLLLSKLYRIVPSKAFSGLAQEAVAAATAAVQDAARSVSKTSGPLHAQLFSAKQLLLLREGIAPLEADFAVVERDLDFSHLRDYLRRTLSGQLPLFSFSSNNAMVQLVSRGPRLSESQLDAKRDLERALKAACEALIMGVTKTAVDPALSFLTKVTAVRPGGGAINGTVSGEKPLREHAFAAPDRVAEVAAGVNAALEASLPEAVGALKLYLPASGTQAALLKPIKANVAEAHEQLDALIQAEYQPDEVAVIGLMSKERLDALLESL